MPEKTGQEPYNPRIVCVGANEESRVVLSGLSEVGAQIVGLVTKPSQDNRGVSDYVDLHDFCKAKNIATIDTHNINSRKTLDAIRDLKPDYIYTLGWSQLFHSELLEIPTKYVVGSHPSPLPKGRGRAPIPWTILQDLRQSAVSLFVMDKQVDNGAILVQQSFEVVEGAYASEVYNCAANALRDAFVALYDSHRRGEEPASFVQDSTHATYRAKRIPADGFIDFSLPAAEIERLVRAVSAPYPGAYTYYNDKKVIVWRADLHDIPSYVGAPGQVLCTRNNALLVQAGDFPLWLSDFTSNDKPIGVDEFPVGSRFGYAVQDELHSLRQQVSLLSNMVAKLQPYLRRDAA